MLGRICDSVNGLRALSALGTHHRPGMSEITRDNGLCCDTLSPWLHVALSLFCHVYVVSSNMAAVAISCLDSLCLND